MNDETKQPEVIEGQELVSKEPPTDDRLSPMVQAVMSGQISTEKVREMLEIQTEYERNEARKAYYRAVAAFKESAPTVKKDKHVEFMAQGGVTSYDHTTLGYALAEINPVLSKYGLSLSWETQQAEGMITVTCYLSHEAGHRESTALSAGADASGKKNPIQQIASTVTYLKRHTAFAILGLESIEDDDGAASGKPIERITEEQSKQIDAKIREHDLDYTRFMGWLRRVHKIDSIDDIAAAGFNDVMRTIDQTIKAKQHD